MHAAAAYLKYYDHCNEEYTYITIEDIIDVGNPIDEDGRDMELQDSTLYICKHEEDNGGFNYYPLKVDQSLI